MRNADVDTASIRAQYVATISIPYRDFPYPPFRKGDPIETKNSPTYDCIELVPPTSPRRPAMGSKMALYYLVRAHSGSFSTFVFHIFLQRNAPSVNCALYNVDLD